RIQISFLDNPNVYLYRTSHKTIPSAKEAANAHPQSHLFLGLCFTPASSSPPQSNQTQQPSLYKRLGGYDAIAAITDDLFGRVVTDPQLSRFFKGHSLDTQKRQRQNVVDLLC